MKHFASRMSMALDLLIKSFFVNLILICLLCVTLIVSNVTFSEFCDTYDNYQMIQGVKNKKMLVYMGDKLSMPKQTAPYQTGHQKQVFFNNGQDLFLYSEALVQSFDIPLAKGSWQCEVLGEGKHAYYPVIITHETSLYRYGSKHEITLQNREAVNVYIAGVLAPQQKYIDLSARSNVAGSEQMVSTVMEWEQFFFAVEERFSQEALQKGMVRTLKTRLLFFEDGVSDAEIQNVYVLLKNQGWTFSYSEIMQNSQAVFAESITFYLPLLLCLTLLCVVSVLGFSVLSVKNNSVYYSCFLLCGGTRRDCARLTLDNTLLISLFAVLLAFFVNWLLEAIGALNGTGYFGLGNLLLSMGIIAVLFAVEWLATRLLIYRRTVCSLLKSEMGGVK